MSSKNVLRAVFSADPATYSLLKKIGKIADETGAEAYVVGGFVRDCLLKKNVKDIDFVVVGDGIAFADLVAKNLQAHKKAVYKKFGTAMVGVDEFELEFVGARTESYRGDSRKPDVEPADLMADLARRDFTINAMAISLSSHDFLQLIDPFNGKKDLRAKLIRTPLEPGVTFSDDPLRIMRGVRFATQLKFKLEVETSAAMAEARERLKIISQERITDELLKIVNAAKPSIGFFLMDELGILELILPEFCQLKGVEERAGYAHKDVFTHTLKVLDNVAGMSNKTELRLTALFHDIAKPQTKEFREDKGWTFHGHEEVGARLIPRIFRRLRLSTEWQKYVQKLTRLHLRPIALTEEECTDSAYRRLLVLAGEHLEELLMLCRADITSANVRRRKKHLANFDYVVKRLQEVEKKDRLRAFQSPVRGEEIMQLFALKPGRLIGFLKKRVEEAILDGDIENDYEAAKSFLLNNKTELLSEFENNKFM